MVPEKKDKRFRPSKAFVIIIVIAALAGAALSVCGVPPTTSVQVVAAVLGGIEAVRRLAAKTPSLAPGAAR
ncbi:hypothetical protein EF912_14495 [Streptomyces sp. WAC07061]|uniref:hypothetical protein n=1 Tax=Streptomyces sp. WAC07061 TaxID=2487410 RepID=UPI000F79E00D|nr:hypothetical protein [Streptomyces sp. WAC07061]RSS56260.1 hypothetical protein EF912_14495 [Streptomyces sp. WAC07061]